LVLPFLTMAFWAMGGGKEVTAGKKQSQMEGLNLQLPNANLKDDKGVDKMSFYDQAEKDSMKLAEMVRNDPYYRQQDSMKNAYSNELEQLTQASAGKFNQSSLLKSGLNTSPYNNEKDPAEEQVMKKLAQLNEAINRPQNIRTNDNNITGNSDSINSDEFNPSVERLENMMQIMNSGDNDDPEIKQLDNTLEKILDVQHPERVKEKIKEKSLKNKEVVFAVSKRPVAGSISLLDTSKKRSFEQSGFYGIEQGDLAEEQNAIEAVIHESQTLVSGAVVKLRLLNDIYIAGTLIPKENFVFGICTLNDERLEVEINSIRTGSSLFPIKLEVYDMDGLPGIYIPGAITRDVAKQSADNSLQLMELSTMDPSLKAQAAAAGINTAKNLLSKKVKLIKVVVKAGYKVLLKDKKAEQ
jgi:conjugative transposon TraM protein